MNSERSCGNCCFRQDGICVFTRLPVNENSTAKEKSCKKHLFRKGWNDKKEGGK